MPTQLRSHSASAHSGGKTNSSVAAGDSAQRRRSQVPAAIAMAAYNAITADSSSTAAIAISAGRPP